MTGRKPFRPDGTEMDIDLTANLVQNNDQTIIQCNVRDVTFRRRFERASSSALPGAVPSASVPEDSSAQPPQ